MYTAMSQYIPQKTSGADPYEGAETISEQLKEESCNRRSYHATEGRLGRS